MCLCTKLFAECAETSLKKLKNVRKFACGRRYLGKRLKMLNFRILEVLKYVRDALKWCSISALNSMIEILSAHSATRTKPITTYHISLAHS